jgi:accessory gene regulator protein AgrB
MLTVLVILLYTLASFKILEQAVEGLHAKTVFTIVILSYIFMLFILLGGFN